MRRRISILLSLVALPAASAAQTLPQRVAALGEGGLRLSFAARPGVCGNGGHSITIVSDDDGRSEWESDCAPGPSGCRSGCAAAECRTRTPTSADAGARPPPAPPISARFPPRQAAAELLALAEQSGADTDELVTAATLADSAVVWPTLLRMARRTELPLETRRKAVFWLGQAAGEAATRGLDSLAGDGDGELEVRKEAVFALSQRPADEGVPVLIRIARTSPHPELRKSALFWLGQSEDPRALQVFEDILR